MNLPVENIVEKAVTNKVNKIVGESDTNLNSIVKMSLLNEPQKGVYNAVLQNIYENNKIEQYYVEQEYQLTIDEKGNLIQVNSINDTEKQSKEEPSSNIASQLSESK
jgi:hypothetical protein